MKDDIDQVVTKWRQFAQEVVQPECGHCQRPVGLVALLLVHGRAPEVIEEQVAPRHVSPQVLIVSDGSDVIEDEIAVQRIPVKNQADGKQRQIGLVLRSVFYVMVVVVATAGCGCR